MNELSTPHLETLRATPLARWLAAALDRQSLGTLVLQEPTGEKHALYLEQGTPSKVHLASTLDPFREQPTTDASDDFERRVVWLANRPLGTRFLFFADVDYLNQLEPRERARDHALALLWRVIRDQERMEDARETLRQLGARQFFIDHTAPFDAFRFSVEDNAALYALKNGSHELESVLTAEVLPRERLERLLYLFCLTGSVVSIAPEALFPAQSSAPPAAPEESSPVQVRPDSYVRSLHPDPLHRAEALLAQGNVAGAEREAALGLDAEPQRADLLALHTWLLAQRPGASLPALWARLDLLVRKAPSSVRVHFYRGLLLKKMGKHASALQEFREVVDRDPHHIDAAREVFLYEKNRDQWLRRTSGDGSGTFAKASPDGILSRLLRRRG
jgi:tetratricopeptide (TPR) repeat protein